MARRNHIVVHVLIGRANMARGTLPRSNQDVLCIDHPKLHESLALQFRAEMFNILNHPNFGPPVSDTSNPQFGQSTQTLGRSLGGVNAGGGAFDPLYQIGGPRSLQFALKLLF